MSTRLRNGQAHCVCCGASTVEHCHTMTKGLARAFLRFAEQAQVGSELLLRDLEFTRSQWQNFTKTKYWGLVGSGEKSGGWVLTAFGRDWANDEVAISSKVWTWRDTPVEYEGESLTIGEIIREDGPAYLERTDYADLSRPHVS